MNALTTRTTTERYEDKLITPAQATRYRAQGWHAADLHVHTSCSYDVLEADWLEPAAIYERALARGMRWVTITDHDTMDAYDRIGWTRPGLVPGVELTILDRARVGHTVHVNVYDLSWRQFRALKDLADRRGDLPEFLEACRDWDLPHTYNHPFWFEPGDTPNWSVIPDLVPLFPVVEYNMHRVRTKNRMALALAERFGKGIVATTDTHIGEVGRAYTLAPGETFREYWRAIRAGEARLMPQDLTVSGLREEANRWIDLVFDRRVVAANRGRKNFTETKMINWVLDGPAGASQLAARVIRPALTALTNSGIPLALYIGRQHRTAARIAGQLGLAAALDGAALPAAA